MDSQAFLALFSSLMDGVQSAEPKLSTMCCEGIDHVLLFRYNMGKKRGENIPLLIILAVLQLIETELCLADKPPSLLRLERHLEAAGDLVFSTLTTLANMVCRQPTSFYAFSTSTGIQLAQMAAGPVRDRFEYLEPFPADIYVSVDGSFGKRCCAAAK